MEDNVISLVKMIMEMTPFLLLGFLCAGILHVVVPNTFYKKHLSENSFKSVLLAALFGIPLPLCSCGVLPTAISLRKEGASKGATTSFLTATPQTGIDSILATYSVFGLPFAIIRPIAALITSLFSGGLVTAFDKKSEKTETMEFCKDGCDDDCDCQNHSNNKLFEIFHYGFVTMLQDIGTRLLIGLIIAGIIAVCVPDEFLLQFADKPLLEMFAVLAIALPMYVCATGSIPIAAALMLKGLTPGAAFVFLMAGPAVSFASLIIVQKVMGLKTMLIYVLSLVFGAVSFGLCIDVVAPSEWFTTIHTTMNCCETRFSIVEVCSTIIFFVLIMYALITKHRHVDHLHGSVVYQVDGMRCNHCKESVETHIKELEGVLDVKADIVTGKVVVEGQISTEKLKQVVESLGFTFKGRC